MGAPLEGRALLDGHGMPMNNGVQGQNRLDFDPRKPSYAATTHNAGALSPAGSNGAGVRPTPSPNGPDFELAPPRISESHEREGRPGQNRSASESRDRSRANGSRRPSGSRICGKCGLGLTGQFVRALGDTYHLDCFTCHDCDKIVASKFFPVPDQPPNQYPLCETDYFRRLDLLCNACGGALRGSYITALDRKYHIEHFTCSVCPTVFGAQDSYYEHEGEVYCHYHYSTKFAQRCNGCQTAILKQFVEIFRNGQNQHWHPECYMIHKYWNVRLAVSKQPMRDLEGRSDEATEEERRRVRGEEEQIEQKVLWIWRSLSSFEEKSATCISDMLLHVSNGAYIDGVMAAKKFIVHVDLLFGAADDLDQVLSLETSKGLTYSREAKLLCKKVVAFFQLLAESQGTGVRRLGVTQELLSLVTGLAHYLKLLIRICLQGSLRLERETGKTEGLVRFMHRANSLDPKLEEETGSDTAAESAIYTPRWADTCPICDKSVEDRCWRKNERVFHIGCMTCHNDGVDLGENGTEARWSKSQKRIFCSKCAFFCLDAEGGFVTVSKLRQYVHLLRVAHARLLATLRTSGALPHTSDDPNLAHYDSQQGHRIPSSDAEPPMLRSETRSKSYTGSSPTEGQTTGSYEQTLGDIRRLRSTRLDKHLSTSMKKTRSSRIIDGPDGMLAQSDAADGQGDANNQSSSNAQSGDGSKHLSFGVNSLALDDIPRLVAAEQAKDQRPNASKYARGNLIGNEPRPKLMNGHRREFSQGNEIDKLAANDPAAIRTKKYFSALTPLEYFIVRHIAVLSMEPLLEGQFNQEELLDLIETRKPTFWDKVGKAFKIDKDKGASKKKGVFGKSLEYVVEKDGAESTDGISCEPLKVPAIVQDAVSAMRTMDMSVEGVFRKNGNIRRLKDLAEEIDAKGGDAVDLTRESPVQVAALLKKFLRDLPDPVLTFKLHRLFIASARIQDEDRRRRILHLTCCLLPKTHRDTMEVLFAFLNWASSFHTVDEESGSKMDIHNLATVIAPNILYSNSKSVDMDASFLAIEAVHTMIQCNESMCEVPDDIFSIMHDGTLFEASAELTTKEILKRWGEIGQVPQATITSPDQRPRSREGQPAAPVVKRMDTDPNVWQNESSVRHVGGSSGANMTYGPSSSHNTPPHRQFEFNQPGAPSGSPKPDSPNRHSQYRTPAYQKHGQVGITGAG